MKILVFDNYDSFTYNLVHYIEKVSDASVEVCYNDKISIEEIKKYDKILLSPGPGIPDEAGILKEVIKHYAPTKSILGVCLGHQAIGEVFGCKLINLPKVYHGLAMPVNIINKNYLYQNMPSSFNVGRYHSWAIENRNIPEEILIDAVDENGIVMGISHKSLDVKGVQFHPESILTEFGEQLIKNWIEK